MDAGRQSEPLTDIALRTLPGSRSASDSACVVRFRSWRHRSLCTGIVPTSAVPGCKRHHRGHRFRAKGGGFALFCSWCARFIWALRSAGSCLHCASDGQGLLWSGPNPALRHGACWLRGGMRSAIPSVPVRIVAVLLR